MMLKILFNKILVKLFSVSFLLLLLDSRVDSVLILAATLCYFAALMLMHGAA